jgi:hypothetical protein
MWMLMAINAALLTGLIVTVWRLRRLHVLLSVEEQRSRARLESFGRPARPTAPTRSGLDEFPEERSLVEARRQLPGRKLAMFG